MQWIKKFFKEEEGTEVVEWALILGLIVVLCVAAITATGTSARSVWEAVETALTGAIPAAG